MAVGLRKTAMLAVNEEPTANLLIKVPLRRAIRQFRKESAP
ncbi:MAG: hypothetical protein ACTS47_00900 [Candidatus Hodgkinia cicadicola]